MKTQIPVVTFFLPRPGHEAWMNYMPMLRLQALSAKKYGHPHFTVTDDPEFKFPQETRTLVIERRPESLMKAILSAQVAFLERFWDGSHPVLLLDVDCLVARNLGAAFDRNKHSFDLLLTHRAHPTSPIQNGAMYVQAGKKQEVVAFYQNALDTCEDHWGGDQEAISRTAAPVPEPGQMVILERRGLQIFFGPIIVYNVSPKEHGQRHKKEPFVIHFKGKTKAWMADYAKMFMRIV